MIRISFCWENRTKSIQKGKSARWNHLHGIIWRTSPFRMRVWRVTCSFVKKSDVYTFCLIDLMVSLQATLTNVQPFFTLIPQYWWYLSHLLSILFVNLILVKNRIDNMYFTCAKCLAYRYKIKWRKKLKSKKVWPICVL